MLDCGILSQDSGCSVLDQASDLFLRFSFLHPHERVQLVEVSVDSDCVSSYFSPVGDRSTEYVSVLSLEKFLNPGLGEFVTVDGFVAEKDNIFDLRKGSLLFPCYGQPSPGVLLSPERIKEVQDDFPTGEKMLDRNVRADLVSVGISETKEDVVRREGDSHGSSQDQGSVVDLVDDHVEPGEKFLVIHLNLVGP